MYFTGTPEIAGLTTIQMLEIIRGLKGLNIVGGDLVEVSWKKCYFTSENHWKILNTICLVNAIHR